MFVWSNKIIIKKFPNISIVRVTVNNCRSQLQGALLSFMSNVSTEHTAACGQRQTYKTMCGWKKKKSNQSDSCCH